MTDTVLVAILSLIGTGVGGFASVMTSQKLTAYKLSELQKQVEKHNQVVERTFRLEEQAAVAEYKIGAAERRIAELEKKVG